MLYGIFEKHDEAKKTIIPVDQQYPDHPGQPTAEEKRICFLKVFLPFLRAGLSRRFLVDTLANSTGLSNEVTEVLISDVLMEENEPIIQAFETIKQRPPQENDEWKGYLIPTADADYTFVIESDNQPQPLKLDDQEIDFVQQEATTNLWISKAPPIKLKGRETYSFKVYGLAGDMSKLSWKTPTSPRAVVPESVLFPDLTNEKDTVKKSFIKLQKAAILVNGFDLKVEEIEFLKKHSRDFDNIDFNAITLASWLRLQAFTKLRDSLPNTDFSLLEFFQWTYNPDDPANLSEQVAKLTLRKKEEIDKLIAPNHFNLTSPEDFHNEKNLRKLQKAMKVADKIGMDINSLFAWAKPISKFRVCHDIAESIRKAIRAGYLQEDWEQVVKPLNDKLRENRKKTLIDYLLVQRELIDWGVKDADSLFEFFLIDVQMQSCMETSRIKQAISSVQIFIQRCFLGLEKDRGVPNNALDRDRWEWMQRYRVWEANRKVFLYPENWIEPNLRDDKSPFFKELESELLQKDINKDTVRDALKNYLYKVDEVANMQVVGLFVEQEESDDESEPTVDVKLHVFSRTRNAPFFFYYRYYDIREGDWYPWEKVQVDIPSYDVEGEGKILGNGTYLIPVVWNSRLLIFFPQFMKKTRPQPTDEYESVQKIGEATPDSRKPIEFWEIKMAWSEYRNGKWTQKQVSKDAINVLEEEDATNYHQSPRLDVPVEYKHLKYDDFPNINCFDFELQLKEDGIDITIFYMLEQYEDGEYRYRKAGTDSTQSESFFFNGNQIWLGTNERIWTDYFTCNFHYDSFNKIYPILTDLSTPYYEDENISITFGDSTRQFYHSFTHNMMGIINSEYLQDFFSYQNDQDQVIQSKKVEAFGGFDDNGSIVYDELKSAYSIYNWELFFHTPTMLADNLSKSQQFEEAVKWFHYVFNPFAEGADEDGSVERFWQFLPFKETKAERFLENLFNSLKSRQSNDKINEWRDKPFRPHVIARTRPSAYMKWVVMKYLDNLMAWADYLFRQHTIETINQATQLYILAGHILGPRPQMIPRRGKIKPQSYNSLLDKWDAFSNAMVELELALPYSNQIPLRYGTSGDVMGFANIYGFGTSLYFCIPNNPKLMAYWDTIEDRLTKIRSCLDIEGVFRIPVLFEPPIDPALLVQATAHGLSLASVLNDLNTPLPNYRFNYLVQKALELCSELKSLGNNLLSALEKKDAEVLSKMRARHESSVHNLVMEVRKLQLEEAQKSLDALYQNRKSPVYRLQHYLQLIGEDLNKIPSEDADFTEVPNIMEKVFDESGLKLIKFEKEEIDKASEAAYWQLAIGIINTLASTLYLVPDTEGKAQPWGLGIGLKFGGINLGVSSDSVAKGMQTYASHLSHQSSSAGRKGGFLRQLQDRTQQANIAGYEIKQIDKQIITQKIRIDIANQEITNQQKQIDNASEIEEYLKNKYTNEELYLWMEGSIRSLYYQTYTLAYDLAKKAEKAYCFDRGLSGSNFIQFGYWDSTHDGLLAGERLYVGLKQLEAAYQEKRGHDYEITKHVSLRQTNPLALIHLKETGKCEFILHKVLFDMDFPGHYMRRIKSLSVSIPCVAGPHTGINCTVRLLENKFRNNAIAKDKNEYQEITGETDERFTTVNIPITSIAVSTGQNDSGVFELNFKDERYMPFEGAGVISKWRLELPTAFKQFDYETINDVILHIRYTAKDGGDRLKTLIEESLLDYMKSIEELSREQGLFTFFDLKHDFPNEWQKAIVNPPAGNERIFDLKNLNERLPIFTKGKEPDDIPATDISIFTTADLNENQFVMVHDNAECQFKEGEKIGENVKIKKFVPRGNEIKIPLSNWQIKIKDTQKEIKKILLVVRYILK